MTTSRGRSLLSRVLTAATGSASSHLRDHPPLSPMLLVMGIRLLLQKTSQT